MDGASPAHKDYYPSRAEGVPDLTSLSISWLRERLAPAGSGRRPALRREAALAAVLILLGAATARAGTVYKCTDANGSISYSDVPCGSGAQRVETQQSNRGSPGDSPTSPAAIQIQSGRYVSPRNGKALDVTARLQAGCGALSCQVRCGNLLAGDPDFGQRKYCAITYRCGGAAPQELRILEGENTTLSCGSQPRADSLAAQVPRAATPSQTPVPAPNPNDKPAGASTGLVGKRASGSDIDELQHDLARILGAPATPTTPAPLVGNVVHNIAPQDPLWTPANPRYVAMFKVVQGDLDRDLQPILLQQRASGEQLLHSLLASHLSDTQVTQLLQFLRTPAGARYMMFQQRLNGIVSQGLSQALLAALTGGAGDPASHDVGSPALLAERLRVLKLSYVTLLSNTAAPGSQAARTEANPQLEDPMTSVLSVVAGLHGPEIDQIRAAYQTDLERFADFHRSAALQALLAVFRAPDLPKEAPGNGDQAALQAALQRSVATHSAAWKAAYTQARQAQAAAPSSTAGVATAAPASSRSDLDGEFPRAPEVQLSPLKTIPPGDEIVLEVGQPTGRLQDGKMQYHVGIRVFDLTRAQVYQWDLPNEVLDGLAPHSTQRASWSPNTSELLYAKLDQAYLISKSGQARPLAMQMPGKLKPFEGVETPALSPDGRFIAYYLYTRDVGDRQPDGFGRLYVDLMYQSARGSQPVTLLREVRPSSLAWSPDGEKLACGTFDGQLIVLDRTGGHIARVQIGAPPNANGVLQGSIYTLRWNPDGTRIGLVYASRSNSGFYTVRPDGTELRQVKFGSADVELKSFSWSPDGRRLVFRSFFQASKICNYSAVGYKVNTGDFPCINGTNVFTSNADGTNLRKISPQPDYSQGELFWIQ